MPTKDERYPVFPEGREMGHDEQEQSDRAILRAVRVVSFTAAPSSIDPFQRSTLTWDVRAPSTHPPIRITLSGGSVTAAGARGSREVSPLSTTGYRLTAAKGGTSRLLATEHVLVDTTGCLTQTISEAQIYNQVSAAINAILAEHKQLSRRRADRVTIEHDGLHLAIRLKADIPNVADPDVDVDATVSFRAHAGSLRWRFERYSFDLDFPWWQDAVNSLLLPAWLAAALAEGNQASLVRSDLSDGLDAFVATATAAADGADLAFAFVESLSGRFEVTLCPKPDPSMFVPSAPAEIAPSMRPQTMKGASR
jgi:hypothetical protein